MADPDDAVQISGNADPLFNVFQSVTQVGTFQER